MSYNVKGLGSIGKRWMALKDFRASGADIVMIQETHFRAGGSLKFASRFFPISYLASDSTGKAGVAILIRKACPVKVRRSHVDPHGRFLILECEYMSTSFTLVNLYAPNMGQIEFLNKLFDTPQYRSQPFMVVGGDFNLVMSPNRDRQALFNNTPPKRILSQANAFRKCIRSYRLFDSWRIKHPSVKQFTFYSPAHKMYSRLDHFFISAPLIPYVVESDISPITWSDHAPITLDLMLSQTYTKSCHWRFNDHLLQSEVSRSILANSLKDYFILNSGSVSQVYTLWEAHKAVFRGACIAEGSRLKRDRNSLLQSLMSALVAAERRLLVVPRCRNYVKSFTLENKSNQQNLTKQLGPCCGRSRNSTNSQISPTGC